MKTLLLTFSFLILAACARHDHARAGDLVVSTPWSRQTPASATVAAGYLTISNAGHRDDRLLAVESPLAERVEIHEMRLEGEVMRMRELTDGLPIPAGQTVVLAPGGNHLMFIAPTRHFIAGEALPATLVFREAGRVPVAFEIRGMAAQDSEAHSHH
ncbi:MAG: copper chaperone PCu(A)C [Stenotrophomonas sp.]